jgi:hypothetical protein
VHHNSYPEIDTADNLITVCRRCHRIIHTNNPELVSPFPYKMVRLTPQAYEILTSVGRKNESYSDVVIRLAEHYKKTGGNKK